MNTLINFTVFGFGCIILICLVSSSPAVDTTSDFVKAKSVQSDLVTSVLPGAIDAKISAAEASSKPIAVDTVAPKKTGGGDVPATDDARAKSSAKPADLDKARTHLTGLGFTSFLEGLKAKLPTLISPYAVSPYVQSVPISSSSAHYVQSQPHYVQSQPHYIQSEPHYIQSEPHYYQSQPIVSSHLISSPSIIQAYEHQALIKPTPSYAVSPVYIQQLEHEALVKPIAPTYAISQQIIHKPVLTEIQEIIHKPVYTELKEIVHKPVLTEVQQIVKRPLFTEHIIKHPSYNSVHQEVIEQPLHIPTEQHHIVSKPLSQIVQLPTQQYVQPIVSHVATPVVSHVSTIPVSSSIVHGSTGGSSYGNYGSQSYYGGFGSQGPVSFPWGAAITKPVISSLVSSSPIISSYTASPSYVSAPAFSSYGPSAASVLSSSSAYSSPYSSFSSQLTGPNEYQFLTPSASCRSGSCGGLRAAVDVAEMPLNYQPTEYYPNIQNMETMPISNLVQNEGGSSSSSYSQPMYDYNSQAAQQFFQQQQQQQQPIFSTVGKVDQDKGELATKSSSSKAKAAEGDNGASDPDTRFLVPSGSSYDVQASSGKPYPAISLAQYLRNSIDATEQARTALDADAKNFEYVLKKVQDSPEAMEKIKNVIAGLLNSSSDSK